MTIDQLGLFDLGNRPLARALNAPVGSAVFSPCRTWRYLLRRILAPTGKLVFWVMLNPSTADASENDKTIDECSFFTRREGGREFVAGNTGAFCATFPIDFQRAESNGNDPIGPDNDRHLHEQAQLADLIIVAWGGSGNFKRAKGVLRDRDEAVLKILTTYKDVYCLGRTKTGEPRHPSRLAHATPLELYRARSA